MKHHPYCEIWPLMSGKDFDKLKADIVANGQRMPVLTYNNQILDGRNRERACNESGIAVRYEQAKVTTDKDALALVVSLNDHRRHLSKEQRAFAAAKLANILNGHNPRAADGSFRSSGGSFEPPVISAEQNNHHAVSRTTAAKTMRVAVASVKRARAILDYGDEDDVADVISRKTSMSAKCKELRPKREFGMKKAKPTKRAGPGRPRNDERRARPPVDLTPTKHLTHKQVDPEFTGTPTEFLDKYGHVQVMTAAQYATARFGAWATNMRALVKEARRLPDWPNVDHNWLRAPTPYDIAKLTEALEFLRPKLAEAEALLKRAVEVTLKTSA